jgi:hypothetical protein
MVAGLAKEAVRRKLLHPFKEVFLEAVISNGRDNTPPLVQDGLLDAALGTLSIRSVREFSRWLSISVEPVLLAICATEADPEIALEAFDILAGRGAQTQPGEALIAWIKARFWDYRTQAVKPVGILGLVDRASNTEIDQALEALLPFSKGGLFGVMIHSGNKYLEKQAVERLGVITASDELIPLLSNDDPEVRIAVVVALKGRNELAVLRSILKAYKREQDPEVQKAFRENHWVTREREQEISNL